MGKVKKPQSDRELLAQGYDLAWFIHFDEQLALKIASDALRQLDTTVRRLDGHIYRITPKKRTKAHWLEAQLYQYLVLKHSTELQKKQLCDDLALDEEAVLVYVYSFIAFNLFRTNSFRTTACNARLLLRLSVDRTRKLFQSLNPSEYDRRDRDDSEYNREKNTMYNALLKIFGKYLTPVTLPHNDKSFEDNPRASELRPLLKEALRRFSPWHHDYICAEKVSNLAGTASVIAPGEEGSERIRMHIAMHCLQEFAQMTIGCSPNLLIPKIGVGMDNGFQPPIAISAPSGGSSSSSLGRRVAPPPLTPMTQSSVLAQLDEARLRRRNQLSPLLLCKVDGQARAVIDLRLRAQSAPIRFSDNDDIIEVWADDVLLGTFLLPKADELESNREVKGDITVEGGQHISFSCILTNWEGEFVGEVIIHYRETALRRIVARGWQQVRLSIKSFISTRLLPTTIILDKTELKLVLRQVVTKIRDEDLDLFDIESDTLIDECLRGRRYNVTFSNEGAGFGSPAKIPSEVADYKALISITVETLRTLDFFHSKPTFSELQVLELRTQWMEQLKRKGVAVDAAEAVATQFSEDLLRAVTRG